MLLPRPRPCLGKLAVLLCASLAACVTPRPAPSSYVIYKPTPGTSKAEVQTLSATEIGTRSVTLSGRVLGIGEAEKTLAGISISVGDAPDIQAGQRAEGLGPRSFTFRFDRLRPGLTYRYMAYAYFANGVAVGQEGTFTTIPVDSAIQFDSLPATRGIHHLEAAVRVKSQNPLRNAKAWLFADPAMRDTLAHYELTPPFDEPNPSPLELKGDTLRLRESPRLAPGRRYYLLWAARFAREWHYSPDYTVQTLPLPAPAFKLLIADSVWYQPQPNAQPLLQGLRVGYGCNSLYGKVVEGGYRLRVDSAARPGTLLVKADHLPSQVRFFFPKETVAHTYVVEPYVRLEDGSSYVGPPSSVTVPAARPTLLASAGGHSLEVYPEPILNPVHGPGQLADRSTWREAHRACRNLIAYGHDDWELPRFKDLAQLHLAADSGRTPLLPAVGAVPLWVRGRTISGKLASVFTPRPGKAQRTLRYRQTMLRHTCVRRR